MAYIIPFNGVTPQQPKLVAPNASLIGDVRFDRGCSVWFGAVLRGDINYVSIGAYSNVQDLAVCHVSPTRPCLVGSYTSMGHHAIAHACTIGDRCMIGMHATVLDGAQIGNDCLIAAGAVVPEGLQVPPGHLVAGLPATIKKPLHSELRQRLARIADDYANMHLHYPSLIADALADDHA